MKAIILAAGKGSRLGKTNLPKPLTKLANGKSILELQLDHLKAEGFQDDTIIIVGYHKEQVMEHFPNCLFVFNPDYARENTAKSLLRALKKINCEDVLWLNGDVVFHSSILSKILDLRKSCMLVNKGPVGKEEVKYRTDNAGQIVEVSKTVLQPEGEALGINFLQSSDLPLFKDSLEACSNEDYFEKGIENSIQKGLSIQEIVIDHELCTEVDFPEDLVRANQMISLW